jgi:hypothetical protein
VLLPTKTTALDRQTAAPITLRIGLAICQQFLNLVPLETTSESAVLIEKRAKSRKIHRTTLILNWAESASSRLVLNITLRKFLPGSADCGWLSVLLQKLKQGAFRHEQRTPKFEKIKRTLGPVQAQAVLRDAVQFFGFRQGKGAITAPYSLNSELTI